MSSHEQNRQALLIAVEALRLVLESGDQRKMAEASRRLEEAVEEFRARRLADVVSFTSAALEAPAPPPEPTGESKR